MHKPLIKSISDPRLYKVVTLPNKLDCLLISDKETDKSAASLDVNVGQINDPVDRPGLAHFLEHMLFLGTKKYPDQNEYKSYISSVSGSNNAYTALRDTNYFLDCSNQGLKGALDRFSQFFIDPLFSESCVSRELHAVDSEHQKNLNQDVWRKMQLFRSSAKEGHPFNKFGTGNLQTLQHPSIRDDLIDFYSSNYSANIMKLCVYGRDELDVLEGWANELFSAIPNKDVELKKFDEHPFPKETLGNFWKILPIKDKDYIEFTWILEDLNKYYLSNPARYFSHLLGHEGKNSLLSFLIDEGLALELSAGHASDKGLFSRFIVYISLTKKGLENYEKVCRIVFQYMKMLKEDGVQEWVFKEIKDILKMKFDFKDKENPMSYVMNLSNNMQYFPYEDIVRLPFLMENYEPETCTKFLNDLTLDNMRVTLVSKSVENECDKEEKWYGTPYSCEPFSESFKQMFENPEITISEPSSLTLGLPNKNKFIPTRFDIKEKNESSSEQDFPEMIYNSDRLEIWFKQDNKFKTPKGGVSVKIYCNDLGFNREIKSFVLLDLWSRLFNESLRETLYEASSAALGVGVSMDGEGVEATVYGFDDSVGKMTIELFNKMKEFDPQTMRGYFEDIKTKKEMSLQNFLKEQPYQQAASFQSALMKQGGDNVHIDEEIAALSKITFEDLLSFNAGFFKTTRAECYIYGNLNEDEAIEVGQQVEEVLETFREETETLPKDFVPEIRVTQIPDNTTWFFEYHLDSASETKESNSAIISLFQHGKETPYLRMLLAVLSHYLKDPCFDRLRTDEQLGYIVSSMMVEMRGILNFAVVVQSPARSPQFISQRIKTFLDSVRPKLRNMTEEEFKNQVNAIRQKILQKDLSLRQESTRYWHEIITHRYQFDRREISLNQLDRLKKQDLLWLFDELFYKKRKLVETQVICENHEEENIVTKTERKQIERNLQEIRSPQWFKRRLSLYPDHNSLLQQ